MSLSPRPKDYEELFNLRHAQARNVVERIFGVSKRRFNLMVASPEYSEEMQAKFVAALCALHNFIRIHDPDDQADEPAGRPEVSRGGSHTNVEELGGQITEVERDRASERRDNIAKAMWTSYQQVLQERGLN